jgi:sugar phosphate isomerase/epimerase
MKENYKKGEGKVIKIGISTYPLQKRYGDKEALRIAKSVGADAIDFNLTGQDYRNESSIYSKSESEFVEYFTQLKKYADSIGLEISQTHGRLPGLKNEKEFDDALIENARLDCYATSLLGAPTCVIHAVTTMNHWDATDEFMHELNFRQFSQILPFAKQYNVKVATETFGDVHGGAKCDFFGNNSELIKNYKLTKERLPEYADYFTVCMDTGHTNKATKFNNNPKPPQAIREIGSDITVLHLNDNNTEGDQHLIPFVSKNGWQITGTIDWDDTFDALDEIGYNGVYNMELELNRYGDEIMDVTATLAVATLRNFISKRKMK